MLLFDGGLVVAASATIAAAFVLGPLSPDALPALLYLALLNQSLALVQIPVADGRFTFNDAAMAGAALVAPGTGVIAVALATNWRPGRSLVRHVRSTAVTVVAAGWGSLAAASVKVPVAGLAAQAAVFGLIFLALSTTLTATGAALPTRRTLLETVRANLTLRQLTAQAFLLEGGAILVLVLSRPAGYLLGPLFLAAGLFLRASFVDQDRLRRLWESAMHDPLTGVLNRRGLAESLARRARGRAGGKVAVCMLDIDRFKSINDRFGHAAGDAALSALGRVMREHVRPADLIGRWGGEEFILVLADSGSAEAVAVVERIRAGLAARALPDGGHATLSAGVAGGRAGAFDDLVACADGALYKAKTAGRDRVVVALPESPAPPALLEERRAASRR